MTIISHWYRAGDFDKKNRRRCAECGELWEHPNHKPEHRRIPTGIAPPKPAIADLAPAVADLAGRTKVLRHHNRDGVID